MDSTQAALLPLETTQAREILFELPSVLGVHASQAARLDGFGKGWWRLISFAITPQAKQAMSPDWFVKQGLINLLDRYDALHT